MDGAAAAFARLYELVDEIEREHLHDLSPAGRRKIVRAVCSLVSGEAGGDRRRSPSASPLFAQTRRISRRDAAGDPRPAQPETRTT